MGSSLKTSLQSITRKLTTVKMVDEAKVKYICDIYDWDGKGEIDLFFLGDVMYALGLNITKKACVGQGMTDEEGKKFAKYDDVVEKVKAVVATPDSQGGYADYLELLKLYDKNSNGTMMLAELDTSSATSETRSPRRTSRSCSLSCVTLRMRMACSPTCHSWTVCLARPKHQNMSQDPRESCHQASSPGRPLSDLLCDNSLRMLTAILEC